MCARKPKHDKKALTIALVFDIIRTHERDKVKAVARIKAKKRGKDIVVLFLFANEIRTIKELNFYLQSSIFKSFVGTGALVNLAVDGEIMVVYWGMPDIMVAFAMTYKITAMGRQNLFNFTGVVRHQTASKIISSRSEMKISFIGPV